MDVIRSLVWKKAACLPVQINIHLESMSPERSGLPATVKARRGNQKKNKPKPRKPPQPHPTLPPKKPNTAKKTQTDDVHEAQTKGDPCWQDDETHVHHFQTYHSPVSTNSFFHTGMPKPSHIDLAFKLAPAFCSQRQCGPSHAAQTAQEQLFGGERGNSVSTMFIKDKNYQHT